MPDDLHRALRESEERYRAFIANTSDAIWRFELEEPVPVDLSADEQIDRFYRFGYLAECNDAMARMYGFEHAGDVRGARLGDMLVRDEPKNVDYLCAFINSGYRLIDAESAEVDREGNTKYFLNNLTGIVENGLIFRAWGTQRDITERKRMEIALQRSEEELSSIIRSASLGIAHADLTGRLTLVNDQMCRILGRSEEEALQMRIGDFTHPDDVARTREVFQSLLAGASEGVLEKRYLRPDGSIIWVNNAVSGTYDATGHMIGVMAIVTDITARREAEAAREALLAELEAANRAKDDFLAMLSHELRTPMTATVGWATMLQSVEMDAEMRAAAIEAIVQSAKAQGRLIDDLLDVSRIVSGKMQLAMRPVALANVVDAAIETVRPAADAKQIVISVDLRDDVRVVGDAERLQQIFWNLLSNAVKFTARNGQVRIAIEAASDATARVIVTDTGEGIDPEFLPHLFERFRQADSGASRRHGGLGLGLSIARNLAEMHGGTLSAASAGPGKGATFTVTLPLQEPAREIAQSRGTSPRVLDSVRVLVVEDDDATRFMLQNALGQFGAMVIAVSTAHEALDALGRGAFDVLISDIGLPGEDGYSLIERVRAGAPPMRDVRALALTAYSGPRERERANAAGYQAYVAKPIDPAALAEEVRRLLP